MRISKEPEVRRAELVKAARELFDRNGIKNTPVSYTHLHEILKTVCFLKKRGKAYPVNWLDTCLKVLDTMCMLQGEDGNYGYTYSTEEKKVLDWDGFAGCWFLPCMACLLYTSHFRPLVSAGNRKYEGYRVHGPARMPDDGL